MWSIAVWTALSSFFANKKGSILGALPAGLVLGPDILNIIPQSDETSRYCSHYYYDSGTDFIRTCFSEQEKNI